MIKEYEQYHGMALCRLAHKFSGYKISTIVNNDNSSYVINDNVGIYIKYSKKRLTPWTFAFNSEHYDAILQLAQSQQHVYILLVCGMDGMCCVEYSEFSQIIFKIEENEIKYISVTRFKNQQYQVSGTDGEIKHKFADADLCLPVCSPYNTKVDYSTKTIENGIYHEIDIQRDDFQSIISGNSQVPKEGIQIIKKLDDTNIKNTSCKHYDDKTSHCLNTDSTYFILNCCGAIHCKSYEKIVNGNGINSITKEFISTNNILKTKKTDQFIAYGDKVLLYSYEDKQQQTLYIGTNNNAMSVIERECLGKKNGDRIVVNNYHYVIVNYKRNINN